MIEIAIAPIVIALLYIYVRDKYEKEPYYLLITGLALGAIISPIIIFLEEYLVMIQIKTNSELINSIYLAFIVAGVVEESIKFLFLYIFIYKNKEFNEPFDGIVYGTFTALGFASVENVLYALNYPKIFTLMSRGIIAIPMHAMYGICMGYYLSKSKFILKEFKYEANARDSEKESQEVVEKVKHKNILKSLLIPIIYHGTYDFLVLYKPLASLNCYIILVVMLLAISKYMIDQSLKESPFRSRYLLLKYKKAQKIIKDRNDE